MPREFHHTLRGLNLKATPKRIAILNLLTAERVYVSPEELWHKLKGRFSTIGLPTVYRILEELSDGGIVSKIIHPNRQLYYYLCPNSHHHHHFICLACRRVEDLERCAMSDIDREVGERFGGAVLSHIVQVNGLCGNCAAMAEVFPGGPS